jgi:hypothetical protein
VERILDTVCFKVGHGQILAHEVQYVLQISQKVIKCCFPNASFTISKTESYAMQKFYPSDTATASLRTVGNELAIFEDVVSVFDAF